MSETYVLSTPYTNAAGEAVTQLSLRRAKVKDLKAARKISNNPQDWDELILSRITGLPPEDFDEMDLADFLELQSRFQAITRVGGESESATTGSGVTGEVVSVSTE